MTNYSNVSINNVLILKHPGDASVFSCRIGLLLHSITANSVELSPVDVSIFKSSSMFRNLVSRKPAEA